MVLYSPGGLNLADTTAPLILAYDDGGSADVVFAVSSSGDLTITPDGGDVAIVGKLGVTEAGSGQIILTATHTHATGPRGILVNWTAAVPNDRAKWFLRGSDTAGTKFSIWADGGGTFQGDLDVKDGADVRIYRSGDSSNTVLAQNTGDDFTVTNSHTGKVWTFAREGWLGISENANANMTIGLTINQGANDNHILSLKSSDVSHPMTGVVETDTYGAFSKGESTAGGLTITGYKSASGAAAFALRLHGSLGEAADTTDTSSSFGVISIRAFVTDGGTGQGTVAGAGNIFTVENNGSTRLLVKGDGTLHVTNTTLVALDEHNDRHLLRLMERGNSARGIIESRWDELITENEELLKDVGVLSSEGDFIIQQQFNKLISGGVWQNYTDILEMRSREDRLESCVRHLVDANPKLEGRETALALLEAA